MNGLLLIGNVMTSVTVTGIPAAVRAPRGAEWAAQAAAVAWRLLSQRSVSRRRVGPPSATRAAAAVRAMARQHVATDPGFAADLMAAADRHEAAAAAR